MKKKIFLTLIFLFLINNCGFTPKYAGYTGIDYNLILNQISGDRELNNYIKSQLRRYEQKKTNDLKIIYIDINSKFEKKTIAKDTKGKVTRYNLIALAEISLILDDETRKLTFQENFKIDKIEDSVEEKNYILIVKKDFSKRIMDKLIFDIRTNFDE